MKGRNLSFTVFKRNSPYASCMRKVNSSCEGEGNIEQPKSLKSGDPLIKHRPEPDSFRPGKPALTNGRQNKGRMSKENGPIFSWWPYSDWSKDEESQALSPLHGKGIAAWGARLWVLKVPRNQPKPPDGFSQNSQEFVHQ